MIRLFSALLLVGVSACAANISNGPATSTAEISSSSSLPEDWGGPDASKHRPEAVIANAASRALNEAWRDPQTRDAVVAVPVNMLGSDLYPYGDGQSNAAPSFNQWPTKERPPVVATLITKASAETKLHVRFDRTLPTTATKAQIKPRNGAPFDLPLTVQSNGDRVGEVNSTSTSNISTEPFAIIPNGWRAGFALSFHHPAKTNLPERVASVLNREQIKTTSTLTADANLRTRSFSERYNNQAAQAPVVPYTNDDVHAKFPQEGRLVQTAVGGGRTWVADARPNNYKTMYQCFDARNRAAESEAGVTSGSGWHAVGDRAETVVNDVETTPILVGFAQRDVLNRDELGPDGFAWNLNAVATIRLLAPNEALVTPRGTLHWFAFSGAQPTCAEIIVSPENDADF